MYLWKWGRKNDQPPSPKGSDAQGTMICMWKLEVVLKILNFLYTYKIYRCICEVTVSFISLLEAQMFFSVISELFIEFLEHMFILLPSAGQFL